MAIRAEEEITLTRVNDGQNGQDGVSPTATVTKAGDTATITITDINGTTSESVSDGTNGTNGISVTAVKPQYYLSTSSSSATGGSWSDTPQAFEDGKYYWTRDHITYSNGTTDTSTAVYNSGMTQASQDAYNADQAATETAKYFWFNSLDSGAGEGAGAHITETEQSTFISDPANGGFNVLIDNIAMKIRNGLNTLANYGAKLILGSPLDAHIEISPSNMLLVTADNNTAFDINAGVGQTLYTYETIEEEIANNDSFVYEINLSGAGRGTELDCNLEDAFSAQYTDSFTIELGTASSGSGTGNLLYSYTYDGDTTLIITNDNNGTAIKFDYIGYFKTSYVPQTTIDGEVMFTKGSSVGVWVTGSGTVDAKTYKLNGSEIDFITTNGTDNKWKWAIYKSGRIEAWCTHSWSNVACTTSAGGGYRSADQTLALPSGLFTQIESCQATMHGSGGSGYTMALRTLSDNTTSISQMFWNTSSATKTTLTVDYFIIGT